MNKYMIIFSIILLLFNFTYAQEKKWVYFDLPVVGYAEATDEGEAKVNLKGFRNPYGVAVDLDNNLWFSTYLSPYYYDDDGITKIYPHDVDSMHTCPIFILNKDGHIDTLKFLTMPNGKIDTLFKSSRGMTTDVYGNIIHVADDILYQIDPISKTVLNYFELEDQGACPAADSLGYIYVTTVSGTTLYILNANNLSLHQRIEHINTLKRNIAVSPSGNNIHIGSIGSSGGGGLYHYHSPDGPNGHYSFIEIILQNFKAYSNINLHYTQWDPSGIIWVGTAEGEPLNLFWALDPYDDYAIVDSISFISSDTIGNEMTIAGYTQPYYIRAPRDVAFSNDGKTMYLADFYGYTIKEFRLIAKPKFIPPGGNYYAPLKVTIESDPADAQVYYTLDETNPTTESLLYTDSIILEQSHTLKAMGFIENRIQSDLGIAEYILQVPKLVFTPDSGDYEVPQEIAISCPLNGVEIYYTLDGSSPDQSSLLYTEPILVDKPTIISAIGFRQGVIPSEPVVYAYNISEQSINISIDYNDIWYDTDFNGIEMNVIDASQTSVTYGGIESFLWTMNNDTVATIANPVLPLRSGTNKLVLTVTTDQGKSKQDTIGISVIVNKIETKGGIYAAVSQLDGNNFFVSSLDDRIYQFDSTGVVRWTIQTGGKIQSTNCINSDEVIFVGSSDTRIYSFDKDGTPNWDKAMGGIILSSPSFGPSRNIYFGVSTGRLFAVSETGNIIWNFQSGGSISSSPSISEEEHIFFGSSDGKIYALNVDGQELWSYQTGDSVLSSPAIGSDSTLVIGSNDGQLHKIDLTGQLIWKFSTGGPIKCSPAIGSDGNIYFGSADGYIYSVSNNGNENWRFNANSPVNGSPSLDAYENVFIGCDDGKLLFLDKQGNLKWYLKTYDNLVAPPLITGNDVIYVGSMDGNIYIIKNNENSMPKPNISGILEWPTFKGNNRRTGFKGDVQFELNPKGSKIPDDYVLFQNYPNPFNSITKIKFGLPRGSEVNISIFNILGQKIDTLLKKYLDAGYHEVNFDASSLANGIYVYKMETIEFRKSKKMIFVK